MEGTHGASEGAAAAGIYSSTLSGDGMRNVTSGPSTSEVPPLETNQWIPESLRGYNLHPNESQQSTLVPLPPVTPKLDGQPAEERDSYSNEFGEMPYHPRGWTGRLPGPAPQDFD